MQVGLEVVQVELLVLVVQVGLVVQVVLLVGRACSADKGLY